MSASSGHRAPAGALGQLWTDGRTPGAAATGTLGPARPPPASPHAYGPRARLLRLRVSIDSTPLEPT